MRIYQCIHKYGPHIPAFEKRWGISDHSSFNEIHDAILRDGYASVYRLIPPSDRPNDAVFFTMWNYNRLQLTWAREQGLSTTDLDDIRLAQIEHFKADVVYDFSSFITPEFPEKLRNRFKGKILCWNGYIKKADPPVDEAYDGYVSLHRPFVESWSRRRFSSLELQPGIDPTWSNLELLPFPERRDDLVMYGQIGSHFGRRAELVHQIANRLSDVNFRFKLYASASKQYYRPGGRLARMGLDLPFLVKWPSKQLQEIIDPPVYGAGLYEAIRNAKAVLNNFTDLSVGFHSNMRIFETIGNGTPLLSPRGQHPEGLIEGLDYFAYETIEDISKTMTFLMSEPEAALEFSMRAKKRMEENFSKTKQYDSFTNFVENL